MALEWFRSYLSDRKQYVFLNDNSSVLRKINCGVPQGSILGPLLFILYINDFCRSSDILSFVLFADDTQKKIHKDSHRLVEIINIEKRNILSWIRANKLSLNLQKTKYMLFSKSINSLPANIIFENTPLECVSFNTFVGAMVDQKLSWRYHIDNICKIISGNIGIIYKVKSLPLNFLIMLYSSMILLYLNYGFLVWGNTHQTSLDKVFLLQKKIIRIICNSPFRSHTDALFFENKILKVKDLYFFQLGQFMYNYNNNMLPSVFQEMFFKDSSVHDYPTRHSDDFLLPLLQTLSAQKTFIYEGPKFWNSLRGEIKNAPSINTFKKELKLFFLQSYTPHCIICRCCFCLIEDHSLLADSRCNLI